jgi:quinol-cytochrome oxidoreductase complex cytochrome b subunit
MKTVRKTIILSCVISFVLHLIFAAGALGFSYITTRNYQPGMANAWENIETLQQETSFGIAVHPLFFLFTFLGTAIICGSIIHAFRKFIDKK